MKVLIINGIKYPSNLSSYDKIFAINYLNYKILKKKIVNIKCLTNFKISNNSRIKFHKELKKNLILETSEFSKRWVYLSKDYIFWRYLNILNYKELIKKITSTSKKIKIVITSQGNKDLNLAIISLKEKKTIDLQYLNLDSLGQTSPHKFGGHYDLINSKYLTNRLFLIFISYIYRIFFANRGAYVKYPNLKKFKNYIKFSDFFSIAFNFKSFFYKLKRLILKKSEAEYLEKINLEEKINLKKKYFDKKNWKNFSNYDFAIINSIYGNFKKKMQNFYDIDKIYHNYLFFFKNAKIKELVLDQDNSMRSKLIIYVLKRLKKKSSFYFHGYSDDKFWFGSSFNKNSYDIDKIYAWSNNSKKNLLNKFDNKNVEVISHNKFKNIKIKKKTVNLDKNLKVLVLGSSWTNMSFLIPNDCFERTVIDSVNCLKLLNIDQVDVKIKPVDKFFYNNYFQAIKLMKFKLKLKFNLINDRITEVFLNKYDLIITDKTTGLFESFASKVHVIVYLGNFQESNFIHYKNLKICKNYNDLRKSINNINSIENSYYQKIYNELISN